jgi:hypothetical protein
MFRKVVVALGVCMALLPASAMAQQGPPGGVPPGQAKVPPGQLCKNKVPPGLTGDARAVAQDAADKLDATAPPAGAVVGDCDGALQALALPAGNTVAPSPLHQPGGDQRARRRQSGAGGLGVLYCQMYGRPYYVSSPTYLHVQLWWSCNGYYNSASGGVIVSTPSSGAWGKPWWSTDDWQGYEYEEFGGIPWYGYHNRCVFEYGYFGFAYYGTMYVQTGCSAI